jgi:hypothetical protein
MRAGEVSLAQARVVARALTRVAPHVDPETLTKAEEHLVGLAAEFGPRQLARLADRVLEVVAPEVAEAVEARLLAAMETEARRRTKITLRRLGGGSTRISGILPDHIATRLAVYLEAHANPRRKNAFGEPAAPEGLDAAEIQTMLDDAVANPGPLPSAEDPVERLPYPRRLGEAFCAFLENVDPTRLPIHGGDATTLHVTIDLASLTKDLAAGEVLTTGAVPGGDEGDLDRLTAGEIRRLACNAQILPVVLGGRSEVLDLGRTRRLFSPAQNRALLHRDRRCRAEGCDIPGTWAEAHHWVGWARGGHTDLADGVLLCSLHHHRIHDEARFTAERLPDGDVRFHRRR